ncbi:MAG: DUF2079 domain-containing protein [Candidatus Nitrospinota bacterium M3_3B_026]
MRKINGARLLIGADEGPSSAVAPRAALAVAVIAYTGWFTHLSLERWGLMLSSLDYAVIDSAAHSTALGNFMWSPEAGYNYWEQHIAPILLFLSAFYLVSDAYWPVFFVQTLTIGLAAVPLYFIAAHFFKNEWLAFMAVLAYFANGTLQVANLFDYHMLSHEPLFFFGAIYAVIARRWTLYAALILLLTICKEDAFVLVSVAGLFAALGRGEWRAAVYTWAFAALYALVVFKIGYPYFRGDGDYEYASYYAHLGRTPFEIVKNFSENPAGMIEYLLSNELRYDRWKTFVIEHGVVLPLASPLGALMLLAPSLELFLANRAHPAGLSHHYPLLVVPVWTLVVVMALSNVKRFFEYAEPANAEGRAPSRARGLLGGALGAAAVVYAGVIVYYLVYGSFNEKVLFFQIRVDDLDLPLAVFLSSLGLLAVFAPPRAMGGKPSTRAVFVLLSLLIGVKLYYVKDYGALPVYSSWARYVNTIDKDHAAKVKEMTRLIPPDAKVATNQGAFAHLHHHTEAYVAHYMPGLDGKGIDHILLDMKDPRSGRRQTHLINQLLTSRPYGVVHEDDGVFLFKRGASKKYDRRRYVERYLTFTAAHEGFFPLTTAVGETAQAADSPYGLAYHAVEGQSPPGYLVYGPYIRLRPGDYRALFRMKIDRAFGGAAALLDVAADEGRTILAARGLTGHGFGEAGKWRVFELPFRVEGAPREKVEFRVKYLGGPGVWLDMIRVEPSPESFLANLSEKPVF